MNNQHTDASLRWNTRISRRERKELKKTRGSLCALRSLWFNFLVCCSSSYLLPIVQGVDVAKESSPDRNLTLDLGQNVTMQMKWIPAGKFLEGAEADKPKDNTPPREVTISKPFFMATTEVTRRQFDAFVVQTGYQTDSEKRGWATFWDRPTKSNKPISGRDWRHPGFEQDADHPVSCVTWNDANRFCEWLSKKSGRPLRLPTEAEWEYACRAGTTTHFQWGNDAQSNGLCNVADETLEQALKNMPPLAGIPADFTVAALTDGYPFTSPVARFKANAWGLHDMHGNLWEWCADWAKNEPFKGNKIDPRGPASGTKRVIRGGCWADKPNSARSISRVGWEPENADIGVGFRVCCEELAQASAASPQPAAPAGTQGASTPADRIKQIKQLMEQGLIDKEEYDRRVKEILDAI